MRARTSVVVGAGGRLTALSCQPPLTVRRVRDPDPETVALCLVGTAAGPLPGDDLGLVLTVGAGGRATLGAAGAQIAQGPRPGAPPGHRDRSGPATVRYDVEVGAGAALTARPGAFVAAVGADAEVDLCLDLAADARLAWTETLVLGRLGEPAGRVVLRWDVWRAGAPLLRQDVDLTDPALVGWSAMYAGARVVTTTLVVAPGADDRTVVHTPTDVTQHLAPGATLRTTLR